MTTDDELQRILEQGETSDEGDFGTYKMVFDGLRSHPEKLNLKKDFSKNVMQRVYSRKKPFYGDIFWLSMGVIVFLVSGAVAVTLTTIGFKIFSSILELKGYIIIFVVLTTLFKVIEKRLHLDYNV